MLDQALAHLSGHGITQLPDAVVGDAGYWHTRQIEAIADRGIEVLVPPDRAAARGNVPAGKTASMSGCARTFRPAAAARSTPTPYALRKITIEPVFGQIKYNRRVDQFMRRDRAAVTRSYG